MPEKKNHTLIAASLLLTVTVWGGNNAGTKWLLREWTPVFTGMTRFLFAGAILMAVLRLTKWLGEFQPLSRAQHGQLWLRGGLSLAAYTMAFTWGLKLASASHVALYIGAAPIWALLAEERPQMNRASARKYSAALLALAGVLVLFWPALKATDFNLAGEGCGILASLLWANYNHQSRIMARTIHGVEVAANSMWMSAMWLLPFALAELWQHGLLLDAPHLGIQSLCVVFGGVVPYGLWNSALRHWQTSRVMLFNNFIPLTTAAWAHFALGEKITPTFCAAMALIVAGVAIGQMDWSKVFKEPESF